VVSDGEGPTGRRLGGMGGEATLLNDAAASYFRRMSFWRRLFGGSGGDEFRAQRLDYLNEALALERQGDYEAALTSYRLGLRDHPPRGPDAQRWVEHATQALRDLGAGPPPSQAVSAEAP